MNIVTINAGSSSVRLAAFGSDHASLTLLASKHVPGNAETAPRVLAIFLQENCIRDVVAVAHRIVHGGSRFTQTCILDESVESGIRHLAPLAPLHNPAALEWIGACRRAFRPDVTQVAVFDTAFYAGLPDVAATYAIPHRLSRQYGVRRYGFHGLAHRAMWQRWQALNRRPAGDGCVISLQLGAGCSITAIRDGRAVDTSMGFSPLEGLVMATRSGDLDPGLLLYLQRVEGLDTAQMERLLNHDSGLLGLSGMTGDMRSLLQSGNETARLAIDIYCYRARKYIGAYFAVLGEVHAILFGGGVGEHAPFVRERILGGMQSFGISLDHPANHVTIGAEALIGAPKGGVEAWVIPVDEQRILAEEAAGILKTQ